jgi:hypothetical protein
METAMITEKNSEKLATTTTDLPFADTVKVVAKVAKLAKPAKTKPITKPKTSSKANVNVNAKKPTKAAAIVAKRKEMTVVTKPAAAKTGAAKTVAVSKAKPAEEADKARKEKLVRDSFTMPTAEYALIAQLKKRCLANGVAAKKSEVLRAALVSLAATSDDHVLKTIARLEIIKTGRPKGKK